MDVNLFHTLGEVLKFITDMIKLIVIVSIITSWIGDPSNQIVQVIRQISNPIYRPFQPLARKIPGPLDWTPILVFVAIIIIEGLVIRPLLTYGYAGGGLIPQ